MNRAIEWFAENHVVANLLMAVIIAGGVITIPAITKEVFPEFSLDMINVSVRYLGAAPEEVEEGVCVKIEEAIQDLEGIKQITSTSSEGVGTVMVELEPGTDSQELLNDIKARVDAIETFPEETEKPVISELSNRRQVIDVAISGNADEATLKTLGERVRGEITAIEGITQVEMVSARPYEVSIEISEEALRCHNLTFSAVANAVRRSSLDMPGGSIRTQGGEILLRTKGQAYRGREFENLVLLTRPDGTRLLLGDVARVVDGFAETDQSARFSGEPAVGIRIYRVGDQNALEIARKVKAYVEEAQQRMPAGVTLTPWNDFSRILQSRLDLMLRNARNGYILVFICLALFLKFRLAWWVSLGIPISFLGAFWLLPVLGVTINLISLFAFIVVLGIVVDDAIIVGENIFKHHERGDRGHKGSASGAKEVAVPVIFGVLTTVAAFLPLLYVSGVMGKVMKVVPLIVITTLLFSLIESLFILPAHLSHVRERKSKRGVNGLWGRFQGRFANRLAWFIEHVYKPSLDLGLRFRYATVAFATLTLLITVGIVGAGWIKFVFFPKVESDYVSAALTLPPGTSVETTAMAMETLEESALRLRDQLSQEVDENIPNPIKHIFTAVGDQPLRGMRRGGHGNASSLAASNVGEIAIELTPSENRRISSPEISRRWREMTEPIPDVVELAFASSIFTPGEPINVQLTGLNMENLQAAANRLKLELTEFAGVLDITDSFRAGKQEVKLSLRPAAETFGLTLSDLARQVRQAFYGEEAQRIQRGRDDVRIMVRYPEEQRRSIGDLENMRIRTSSGGEVPFSVVAEAEFGRGYASIQRVDRRRAINVTADVDPTKTNAGEVLAELRASVLPLILADYPGVSYSFEGEQRERAESMGGLIRGFIFALIIIFALMAIPFKSYIQPLIVICVIPFGFVGAVWGHIIMRLDLTILSMFGLVALTGVVVNDSIVLVHFVNQKRREGLPVYDAVCQAGMIRFRPILLTSLTTFAGLLPLYLERSVQAKFLVPMAVSLGFGVVFSTFITLMIVPTAYLILEDIKSLAFRMFKGQLAEDEESTVPSAAPSSGSRQ
ncbi:MAG: AcrB/AcrD/AcrF family protein [Candidatus Latescibacteria bacterium]|nr:AcrB/AcrD/AcrF family protein [Candidatus Latescibacterota bacterium]NIO56195.1 AcrB/AcrD/AcrF family protein [Candidatus Latescibacterota bacterium]